MAAGLLDRAVLASKRNQDPGRSTGLPTAGEDGMVESNGIPMVLARPSVYTR